MSYYTPEISEFCIGFEYETCMRKKKGDEFVSYWEKNTVEWKGWKEKWNIPPGILVGHRVKFLDQDDIESLGFEKCTNKKEGKIGAYINKSTYTGIQPWKEKYYIYNNYTMFDREELVFAGTIKNKSELKKILKQIGV